MATVAIASQTSTLPLSSWLLNNFGASGEYRGRVAVRDKDDGTIEYPYSITVRNLPPWAKLVAPAAAWLLTTQGCHEGRGYTTKRIGHHHLPGSSLELVALGCTDGSFLMTVAQPL